MSTSSVRISDALVREAGAEGAVAHRPANRQLEYWAELGRAVDRFLRTEDLIALRQGLAKLQVTPREPTGRVDPAALLQAVDAARRTGDLGRAVRAGADVVYQSSPTPGRIVAIYADGRRAEGTFVRGEFTPG